ncbi:MAG: gamma carbonic anhydrase family protein [Deltaproteobacteria bacterium]|nr:gamma carbonic anhydrase family protein [Deltaproteobacteria bacterium]
MRIEHNGRIPQIAQNVYMSHNTVIIGDVVIGEDSSIWFGSVVRGDENYIRIGRGSNIQDLCMLHVTHERYPLFIGDDVTIGHRALVHGCRIKSRCLIGMGAVLLDGTIVGEESIVAAGSVVKEGMIVPPQTLVAGVPAQIKRDLNQEDIEYIVNSAKRYVEYARHYMGLKV